MWVSAEEDFLICKLMSNTAMTFTADLHLPSKAEKVFNPRQDVVAVVDQQNIRYQNGIQLISRGFTKDVDIPATATAALRILSDAKAQPFTLSPDRPVYLVLALSSNFKQKQPAEYVMRQVEKPRQIKCRRTHGETPFQRAHPTENLITMVDSRRMQPTYADLPLAYYVVASAMCGRLCGYRSETIRRLHFGFDNSYFVVNFARNNPNNRISE